MTNREIFSNQLNHIETPVLPYTITFDGDVGERLTEHYGSSDWTKRIQIFLEGSWCVGSTNRIPIDDMYERDLYGGIWRKDCRPTHLETPPLSQPNFDGYEFPKAEVFFDHERKEADRIVCTNDTENFRLGFIICGLFECCWQLRGFENSLMDAVEEPDFFQEMVDRLTDLYLQFTDYMCELPLDGIFFCDDWGDQQGVIIGADRWRKFFKPAWAKIYERARASGKRIISHCCGSVVDIMPDLIEIGLDCLESCQPEARGMNPYELKKRYGDKMTFWGGLGSQRLLPFGTPESIRAEIAHMRKEMYRGGGYIMAPAKALQPETPTANAVAIVEALTELNDASKW